MGEKKNNWHILLNGSENVYTNAEKIDFERDNGKMLAIETKTVCLFKLERQRCASRKYD